MLDRLGFAGVAPWLNGERVCLRPPAFADWPEWARLRAVSRDFLTPWEPSWPPDALKYTAYRRRLKVYSRDARDGWGYTFFIVRRSDEVLLGGITLSNIRRGVAQSCSVGYWIGKPHARRGYMTEALGVAVSYAFDDLGLHRIEAACLPANQPSQRLLRACGFMQEGYARQYLRINGRWEDHVLFGRVASDRAPGA